MRVSCYHMFVLKGICNSNVPMYADHSSEFNVQNRASMLYTNYVQAASTTHVRMKTILSVTKFCSFELCANTIIQTAFNLASWYKTYTD
jgi:hypothetical protein